MSVRHVRADSCRDQGSRESGVRTTMMKAIAILNVSRRDFLKSTAAAGAGLTLGFMLSPASAQTKAATAALNTAVFAPNAFVRIGPDNTVTVLAKHLEMGQGTYTGLATLGAEELDAAWPQVVVDGAPANAALYNDSLLGPIHGID